MMERIVERDDNSIDILTLDTPNLANVLSSSSSSITGLFSFIIASQRSFTHN